MAVDGRADPSEIQHAPAPWWRRWLWRVGNWVIPLPLAVYINRSQRYLGRPPEAVPDLPDEDWVRRHQEGLLDHSEERLRGIEAKGPALATTSGIFAAGIGVAIAEAWPDQSTWGRLLLVGSAVYIALSLVTPIILVGPQRRATVTLGRLRDAVEERQGEAGLAHWMAEGAVQNDVLTLRLSNLQVASRNMLVVGTTLFLLWGLLTITGAVADDGRPEMARGCPDTTDRDALFLVHGRNHLRLDEVKRFLERRQTLPVVVLADQPNAGQTVFEKLLRHACQTRYAVVIYTGDDQGRLRKKRKLRPRARQNVVFELGLFYGLLPRGRVTLLLEPGTELPSDVEGVAHAPLDGRDRWRVELLRDLEAAGVAR